MIIVDTHCHAGISWFEPVEVVLYQMNMNGVQHAVLIQHRGAFDNRYLLESVKRYPGRFTAVVNVDPAAPDALGTMEELAKEESVGGFRFQPTDRSPGNDPLAIWRKAEELGLPVSVFLVNAELCADPEFRRIVESLPNCTFVLEHLCGMLRFQSPHVIVEPYTAYRTALELAQLPNTYVKVGGLGEFSTRPPRLQQQLTFGETPPMLEMAYEVFGPRRIMWGSDFPPVAGREGYRNALYGVMEYPTLSSEEEREWVFGKTALSVWTRLAGE